TSSSQNYDYVTIKYSPAGFFSGIATYNGTGNASDVANTLTINGNSLYVTGGSYGTTSQRDLVTIKYDLTQVFVNEPAGNHPGFIVYPNPLTGEGTIELQNPSHLENLSISFYDVTGREVKNILDIQS